MSHSFFAAIEIGFALWFVSSFASYCWRRTVPAPAVHAYQEGSEVWIEESSDMELSAPEPLEGQFTPFACPIELPELALHTDIEALTNLVEPIYSGMTTPELRKECTAVGIQWRCIHGKNRHMKKAEMVAALLANF